ncbi:MAG: 50S ribosomal protein L18 [Planctomycetia bacterium]|jgi:large subunit ribosomal protein L18|nr:50S ribosomal protein L18 [Planctomycetia bacterium]
MDQARSNLRQRIRRQRRVRKPLRGTPERPRLSVRRSHKHIYAQIIDDTSGRTLAAASTVEPQLKTTVSFGGNKDAATAIGKTVAERAKAAGVSQVCFDRGPCRYHGRVAALADAAREAGLEF